MNCDYRGLLVQCFNSAGLFHRFFFFSFVFVCFFHAVILKVSPETAFHFTRLYSESIFVILNYQVSNFFIFIKYLLTSWLMLHLRQLTDWNLIHRYFIFSIIIIVIIILIKWVKLFKVQKLQPNLGCLILGLKFKRLC